MPVTGIATAIIAMARSLDLHVITDGIETREHLQFLQQAGCPKLPGHLFSQLLPPDAMQILRRDGSISLLSKLDTKCVTVPVRSGQDQHCEATMRYHHSSTQSAECLRLAVKHMTQQQASFHPASYAVWYQDVAGINPHLPAEVDELLQRSRWLDDGNVYVLYDRYTAEFSTATALCIGESVSHHLDQVPESAAQMGHEVSRFGDLLEGWSDTQSEPVSAGGEAVIADFVNRADRALYLARTQGRNRVILTPRPQPANNRQIEPQPR
ncbi:MAG TPA: EAL domain-containing protein [Accumulibacter sp.]|nr:EAL domain-containing protein [Accumulibacter sp.]